MTSSTVSTTSPPANLQTLGRLHVPGYVPPAMGWFTQMGVAFTAGLGAHFVLLLLNFAGHA